MPLPFTDEGIEFVTSGTTVSLSDLDNRLNFPTTDRLREVLIYEYGREATFKVFVNGEPLSVQDVPGTTAQITATLPNAGSVNLHYTIAEGKRPPKYPGIILKVNGKAVGRPMLFGLDEDETVPLKLARRVYGEVELTGVEDFVTADWGSVLENSKTFQEAKAFISQHIKAGLAETHARDLSLQKARLQREINQRLQGLPEYRRKYAEEAIGRIFKKYYGETEDRMAAIIDVALDAMEHDAYWAVLDRINKLSKGDVGAFAESLEDFGLMELATMGAQTSRRLRFLDHVDQLIENPMTLEKDAHKALESNLWVLGRRYEMISSNATLRNIIQTYCGQKFKGSRADKRPDLLLSQGYRDTYLLIEFKRPAHDITRDDIAQAEKYRDDLSSRLSSTGQIEIMMIGKGRKSTIDSSQLHSSITIHSYSSIIGSARSELEWLITALSASH